MPSPAPATLPLGRPPTGLPETLARRLAEEIGAGRPPIGERLPGEQAMAARYGVSRAVVREAVSRLRQDGLVEVRHGRGAFVAQRASGGVFRISAACFAKRRQLVGLLELRTSVEADAAALAARHRGEADLVEMAAQLGRMARAAARGRSGATEWVDAENAFYAAVARAAGNEHFRAFLGMMATQIGLHLPSVIVKNAMVAEGREAVLAEHRAVWHAVAERDEEGARAAARNHFSLAAARLVARADLADV